MAAEDAQAQANANKRKVGGGLTGQNGRRLPLTMTSTMKPDSHHHRPRPFRPSHRSRVPANPPPPNPHAQREAEWVSRQPQGRQAKQKARVEAFQSLKKASQRTERQQKAIIDVSWGGAESASMSPGHPLPTASPPRTAVR